MSKNNLIRKSDKKFIRLEKARIRRQFLDLKKQAELIDNLYKKFEKQPKSAEIKKEVEEPKKAEVKKEEKPKVKKEKAVKTAK